MVKQIKWLDRKFEFSHPPGMMPVLLDRMLGTLDRIKSMIDNKPDGILSKKTGGNWSVKEHIGHLTDLEALHESRLDEILNGKETLTPADMSNKKTNEAGHNTRNSEELFNEFKKVRESFVSRLNQLNEDEVVRSALHPRLNKQMRINDIAFFTAEHDDQHLTIIRNILNTQENG
jgi:hypothetical protein